MNTQKMIKLEEVLTALYLSRDTQRDLSADPIRFPKRFKEPADQEVVACFSALLAYGRVRAIGQAIEDVLRRIGQSPAELCVSDYLKSKENDCAEHVLDRFNGFIYRFTRGVDLAKLWLGIGGVIDEWGGLGMAMRQFNQQIQDLNHTKRPQSMAQSEATLIPVFTLLYKQLIEKSTLIPSTRGFNHLLSNPERGSAIKRINLLLRWMVRGGDEVDLGLWTELGSARLVMPLDAHVFRSSRALGLTRRKQANLKAAVEVTQALRQLDPLDPLKYDFPLAHLGISGACKGRRIHDICDTCPLEPLCTLNEAGEVVS